MKNEPGLTNCLTSCGLGSRKGAESASRLVPTLKSWHARHLSFCWTTVHGCTVPFRSASTDSARVRYSMAPAMTCRSASMPPMRWASSDFHSYWPTSQKPSGASPPMR